MPPERLSDEAVESGLKDLGWERRGDHLVKVTERPSFRAALEYVTAVGDLAEAADHHPDIHVSWRTVTLELWTHVSGGITARDLELAAQVDALG